MSGPVVVAVDISSSGVRARAHLADLTVLAEAAVELPATQREDGASYHALDDVLAAVREVVLQVATARQVTTGEIAAVVASGTASSLVGFESTDDGLQARTEALLWSDTRALPWFAGLRASLVEAFPRTLCPPDVSYWPAKLAMLAAEGRVPERLGSAKDAVFAALTGRLWTDPMSAASTGVYDSAAGCWDAELLGAVGVSSARLPEVREATAWAPLTDSAATGLGLSAGTPIVVGGMDGPLSQLGTSGGELGIASCTVGTSIAFRASSAARVIDPTRRTWCYPVAADLWVSGGAGSNGGNLLTWLQTQLGFGSSVGEIVDGAFAVEPDPELIFVPSLNGERAPLWRSDLRAALVGLAPHHDSRRIARAVVEGVAACAIELSDAVRAVSGPLHAVGFTGGFLREPRWVQLLTDALGVDTVVPDPDTATSSGAAMVAWAALDGAPLSARPAPAAVVAAAPRHAETARLSRLAERTAATRHALWPDAAAHPVQS
jgi:gluconokinase